MLISFTCEHHCCLLNAHSYNEPDLAEVALLMN